MSIAQLLADYGYWAVFIGGLREGETILVLAGFAAHQGHLSLPLKMTIALAVPTSAPAIGRTEPGRADPFSARCQRLVEAAAADHS
jgi:hypothetical protein